MNFYLNKYGFQDPEIEQVPSVNLGIIVVIPCFNEPDLIRSLESLASCVCTKSRIEVIVVLNGTEQNTEEIQIQNKKTKVQFQEFKTNLNSEIEFHLIENIQLPKKHAGVGLARKIGMDEAVSRFDKVNTDGIIVCFDADAIVAANYFVEIEKHFNNNPKTPGCAIHYEHPISGREFKQEIYQGIINYELHLRYYNQCLVFAKLPYAFHTVGSSMAVKSSAYQKQGGMNKRKAGEDFYFIHKIISLGDFGELKSTMVIPSPRISDRVPFGTGKAIGDWIDQGKESYSTYAFEIFIEIKNFVELIPALFTLGINCLESKVSDEFCEFLIENKFDERLAEIRSNTTDFKSFEKRFFVWFDAFKILKLVHFLRDTDCPNQEILQEVQKLETENKWKTQKTVSESLFFLREIEKS